MSNATIYDKLIFLDIDGVLNMYGASYRTFMKPYGQHIEPTLVSRLNYLFTKLPNLAIVVSSSWRSNMPDLEKQMTEQGFLHWDKVIGKTDHIDWIRGNEILTWITTNNYIGKYCVLDDESTDIHGEKFDKVPLENCVFTDGDDGLLHSDVKKIIKILQ